MSHHQPQPEDEAGFDLPPRDFLSDFIEAVVIALVASVLAIAIIVMLALIRGNDLAHAQEVADQWDLIRLASRTPITAGHVPSNEPDRAVVGGRPPQCRIIIGGRLIPFCGCDTSLQVFNRVHPELLAAKGWLRFRRAAPMPGMVGVRKDGHHVLLLLARAGDQWRVRDPNSGKGLTREYVRSLAGFTIVDPHAPVNRSAELRTR